MVSLMKLALFAGSLAVLAGCQPYHPITAASVDQDLLAKVYDPTMQCGPAVTAALTGAGISAPAVKRVVVEKNTAKIAAGDEIITGYRAWTDLNACKGNVVVDVDSVCRVTQIYSRGDCTVPGVAHY